MIECSKEERRCYNNNPNCSTSVRLRKSQKIYLQFKNSRIPTMCALMPVCIICMYVFVHREYNSQSTSFIEISPIT